MSRIIIDPYPHQLGGHCGSGALRDLVHWAGLGWDNLPGDGLPGEGLVFGLGGGLSFMYTRYPGLTPPLYLVGRNADMELDFCQRLGIETRRQQTDNPDEAWRWIRNEIDEGHPVMVWCDIAELPYLRVRLSNTRHDVVIIGYDDDRNMVFIIDNDREEVQEVPMDAFRRAHGSHGFPGPNRFATYPMRFPARLPDLLTCAREAAASAARVLGGEDALLFDASTLPEGSVIGSGVEGVRAFADDVITWPHHLPPDELTTAVRSIPVFVEKAGTGGGLFRRLEASFCLDVAQATGDQAFAAAANACHRSAEAWSALGETSRAEKPDIEAVSEAAHRLPELESAMQKALELAGQGSTNNR
ncbi:Butirosin biosynthesis protein H, N-terminal [Marinobacter segnicrescens]|uniref:Butirosin biosynthesis protein H, N-terminal n=1 Tax=Marinobacter segnicrescens TaxID=430453 RepID=A0A1I0IFT2_9GAMM|nr:MULTISPECIES: BtrH N-terminal domain-containing protein [Marinobacter]SET95134.1 Butirosin biosynthesis protein H, N-terminal [Marinobacter segnicrescens]